MADVGIIEGEKLLIQIGDGGSPEAFAHPCLINTDRNVDFKTNMTETEVANCTTPETPAKIVRKAKSTDFSAGGAGKVDKTSVLAYIQWWASGLPKNVKIVQNTTGALGGFTGTVPMLLETFTLKGTRGDYQDVTINLVPSDVSSWAANA